MNKRFRTCSLDQPYLLPPCLQDWLPSHHLARCVAEVVSELDLSAIYAGYDRKDGRGLAAYHPLMLTRVLLYAYCVGMTSSRRIEKATYEDVAIRFLAADQHPDHDTIAAFRQQHLERLAVLFIDALRLCQRAGLVKLGNVALDGTKLRANASRHRSHPYSRLTEQEKQLQATVGHLLEQAQQTDSEEDERYGKGRSGDELPPELADAESRLEKIREAKRALEQEAAEQLEQAQRDHPNAGHPGRPRKDAPVPQASETERQKRKIRLRRAKRNAEQPSRQYNFTDPDSRVMHDNGTKSFTQAYNAQAAVDGHAQVIVAADVTQEVIDRAQLLPMCECMRETLGALPPVITADTGYWDSASIENPVLQGIELLIPPAALRAGANPDSGNISPTVKRMREKLSTTESKQRYAQRQAIVEPVFGQIKAVRGLNRFALRGLEKVRAEWKLICLTHNLLKYFRHGWVPQGQAA
jgi:transposase